MDRALRLLARREYGRQELGRRLMQVRPGDRKPAPELIVCVLDRLSADGYQSDERYAQSYVRSRVGRGYGPLYIRQSLEQAGIDSTLIDVCLDQSEEDWEAVASAQIRARRSACADAADSTDDAVDQQREWARSARRLSRRGFPADMVRRVLGSPYASG